MFVGDTKLSACFGQNASQEIKIEVNLNKADIFDGVGQGEKEGGDDSRREVHSHETHPSQTEAPRPLTTQESNQHEVKGVANAPELSGAGRVSVGQYH